MLTLKKLQSLTKEQIRLAFPGYFTIELQNPATKEFYEIIKTFVTIKDIKLLFKKHFEENNLKLDLRRLDSWSEIYLNCRRRINDADFVKAENKKELDGICHNVKDLKSNLEMLLKELAITGSYRRQLLLKSDGYNERFCIAGTKLEIGIGTQHVTLESSDRFKTLFTKTYLTYAVITHDVQKKYNADGIIENIDTDIIKTNTVLKRELNIKQLREELISIKKNLKLA